STRGGGAAIARAALGDRAEPGRGREKGALPRTLKQLRALVRKGLDQTDSRWPDERGAFAWVHRVAHILKNAEERSAPEVVRLMRCLLGARARHQEKAGTLAPALKRFLKVTRSYWPGLFHCYAVAGLPRTNNDLEQFFGSCRHHERRATGRKG